MPKKIRGVKKPKKYAMGRYYLWRDITAFLHKKHKIDILDESHNFWHWMTANSSVHNGSFYRFSFDRLEPGVKCDEWIKDILRLIKKEFAPKNAELKVWVDW